MKIRNPKSPARSGTNEVRNNEYYISRCIELAKKGAGYVSPNPMVGCVIVKNGEIISEGYHKQYGSHHAEVNAINAALEKRISLKGAVMYVNLEPCVHHGKTPPCVDRIIESKISRVVIGTKDPNRLVSGKGIKALQKHKIKVTVGVLEAECSELNKFYFKHIKTGLPYVTLKAAQTLDGKIADADKKSKRISSESSRRLVHKLRSEYDAVLVGRNTVEIDNPSLTVRLVKGRNPYRIVIDKGLVLNIYNNLFSDKYTDRTIIISGTAPDDFLTGLLKERRIRVVQARLKEGIINLKDALKKIAKLGISSIMVEGGAFTFTEFIKQSLADEVMLFMAPKFMGSGVSAFRPDTNIDFTKAKNVAYERIGTDILIKFKLR